jgi:hypothetical protein
MTTPSDQKPNDQYSGMAYNVQINNWGMILLATLSLLTLITFIIAFLTPPLSGPLCEVNCYQYPYHDIISRFPRDYYWMYLAILLNFIYIPAMVLIHYTLGYRNKIMSLTGLLFAFGGAILLATDYFLQLSVIQPSLLRNETEGIAILSQYNAHGVFIVLEELGYLLISISFFFLAFLFRGMRAIRSIFLSGFLLSLLSLILVSIIHGIHREYIYEIAVISIVWLVLIINGLLIALYFRKLNKSRL